MYPHSISEDFDRVSRSVQVKAIRSKHGKKALLHVAVDQFYGWLTYLLRTFFPTHMTSSSMRGPPALIWDGSVLDADVQLHILADIASHQAP